MPVELDLHTEINANLSTLLLRVSHNTLQRGGGG